MIRDCYESIVVIIMIVSMNWTCCIPSHKDCFDYIEGKNVVQYHYIRSNLIALTIWEELCSCFPLTGNGLLKKKEQIHSAIFLLALQMILTQVDVCVSLCYWDASTLPRSRGKWPFLKQFVDLECVVAKIKTSRREMECHWSRCWLWTRCRYYDILYSWILLCLS